MSPASSCQWQRRGSHAVSPTWSDSVYVSACVSVCGSASGKLCVNDGGERCLYTLILTEIKSRSILKEWESKYAQCTIYNMPCYLKKKKDVNIHISLLVSSFLLL